LTRAGSRVGRVVVFRDVTELERKRQDLQEQNERLEEFVSVVSHDLRNPLNVASGRVELARAEHDSDHLAATTRAHDRMEGLISDLLTLAREGEAVRDPERTSLPELFETAWRGVQTGDGTLVVRTDAVVEADPGRLRQLFENLVRNAVEHGGSDVTVIVGETSDGFYVADDGPGIPEDEREQVVESGYSTTDGGTGFGLAIVSEIATAHGWDVTVTESDTGGARFEFSGVQLS